MSHKLSPRARVAGRRRPKFARLSVQLLEDRALPSGLNYCPPSYFVYDQGGATLSAPSRGDPLDIANSWLQSHAADFHLIPADLADAVVTSRYTDDDSGTTHLYLRQTANGLPVHAADLALAVGADGRMISAGGGFVTGLKESLPRKTANPVTGPFEAVRAASAALGLPLTGEPIVMELSREAAYSSVITGPGLSTAPITAQLHYVPTPDGKAVLAWQLNVQTPDGLHWYDLSITDGSGELIALADWTDSDSYNALPLTTGTPVDGGFRVLSNPAHTVASPFGWHDTNGAAGAEFTDTRGNNVDAHLDRNADNVPDTPRPSGGAALDFSTVLHDPASGPTVPQNPSQAVVNLFYVNNTLHDIHYQYGFTPAAGNFQVNNYGLGGLANDAVNADAQDGSGTNNANFSTPVDGAAPRMQMYLYTLTTPNRDGDFDDGTVTHEYGHGVSNRLTGGPGNSSALNNTQSGGMGEGWSDFYGAMFLQRASDVPSNTFGHSTYTRGEDRNGDGNRRFPYSFSFANNPLTWDAYGTSGTTSYGVTRVTSVHATGEIWCSTLWDLNWLLCAKYGFDPDLLTGWSASPGPGHAGNKLALKLVMDGLKLQPANPSFTQARDAIIAADVALTGGANLFEIWTAFARRGLGATASTPGSSSTATPTLDFTIPVSVQNLNIASSSPAVGSITAAQPTAFTLNVSQPVDPLSLSAADFTVNGIAATSVNYTPGGTAITFTYTVSPVTAQGLQIMAVAAGAFTRASDANPVTAYSSSFRYDAQTLAVSTTSPAAGVSTPPLATLDLNFNEPVLPASVAGVDLMLSQGYVSGFSLLNGNQTIRYTLVGLTAEANVTAYLNAGAVTDVNGGPNAAFTGNFNLDYATLAFPTPLTPRGLPGALVYDNSIGGTVGYANDTDSFTISLDAGQTLDVIATPGSTLRPSITVTGPGTNQTNTASANGATARLATIPIVTAGTYTLSVTGAASTIGNYSLQAILNQAAESESFGGAANNTTATAQSLTPAMLNLGDGLSRAAVRGRTELAPTAQAFESEPNGTTGTADNAHIYYAQPNNLYQIGISGAISSGADADYFNIGALQVGDVLTLTESGLNSGRGTNDDPLVRLYRAGTGAIIVSDDDSGPGSDSLVHRFTIDTADTYFVRAHRFGSTDTGTWQLGIWLENAGTAPTTGGTFTAEVEPNESTGAANNAANAWQPLAYFATASGTISAGDTDIYSYQFTAGDVVTLLVESTSSLVPQSALLNSAGTAIATENGTSVLNGVTGVSPIYSYVIPTTGTYYIRVQGVGGSTGSYTANVSLSTPSSLPVAPLGKDFYSFNLATSPFVTVALENLTAGPLDLALLDSGGAVVATGVAGATNADEFIANYFAPGPGPYYLQVSGPAGVDYQATVLVGGSFDAEANDGFAAAQPLGQARAALGHFSGTDDWYQFNANAGELLMFRTETPGDGGGEFVNAFNPRIEIYTPGNTLAAADDNSAADGRNAQLSYAVAASGSHRVRVANSAGTSGEYVLRVANLPPAVLTVDVNNGAPQRSRVTSLTVTFNTQVSFATGAFRFTRGATLLTSASGGGVLVDSTLVGGQTVATLTFDPAVSGVDFGSLADGHWTLTLLAANVTQTETGLPMTANSVQSGIKRLFGDSNGDATVDGSDLAAFGAAFGSTGVSPFDFNNDLTVDALDLGEFGNRFGMTL